MVRRLGRAGQDAIFALEFMEPAGYAPQGGRRRRPQPGHSGTGRARPPRRAGRPVLPSGPVHALRAWSNGSSPPPPPSTGCIRVVGGPGTGKRHQASKWLRQHTGQEPKIFTAGDLAADDRPGPAWRPRCAKDAGSSSSEEAGLSGELRGRLADIRAGFPAPASTRARASFSLNAPAVQPATADGSRRASGAGTRPLPRGTARRAARRRARGRGRALPGRAGSTVLPRRAPMPAGLALARQRRRAGPAPRRPAPVRPAAA